MPYDTFTLSSRMEGPTAIRVAMASSLFFSVLVLRSGDVQAARDDEALVDQGIEARQRNDDAKALSLFRRAYALRTDARTLAQISLAEFALGDWLNAEEHLQKALEEANHPWISKNQGVLRESLSRIQMELGNLLVVGGPEGAEVVVDGRPMARLPMSKPLRVRVGSCSVELRAKGYVPVTRTVKVVGRQQTTETVQLASLAESDPAEAVAATASPRPLLTQKQEGPSSLRVAGLSAMGLGVAGIGTGIVFGLLARSANQDNQASGRTFDPVRDQNGKNFQTWQYLALGIGTALVAGGAFTYWLGLPPSSQHVAIIPTWDKAGAQASWGLVF